jgi:hypothetical protein
MRYILGRITGISKFVVAIRVCNIVMMFYLSIRAWKFLNPMLLGKERVMRADPTQLE